MARYNYAGDKTQSAGLRALSPLTVNELPEQRHAAGDVYHCSSVDLHQARTTPGVSTCTLLLQSPTRTDTTTILVPEAKLSRDLDPPLRFLDPETVRELLQETVAVTLDTRTSKVANR
jgi:hypothetical protein